MESTRPDHIDNNTMKHHSQSSELTGSLAASESLTHYPDHSNEFYEKELKRYNVGAQDYMYNWIRSKSGK
jgi:hypothetical protein